MHPLIEVPELVATLDHPAIRIVDLRWSLTDPSQGRGSYLEEHLPGAVFADLDTDLSSPPGLSGRHPLPTTAAFAAALERMGIDPNTRVVVYDEGPGAVAARLWWMLRSIGHTQVQLLNGGFAAWLAADAPTESGEVEVPPRHYPVPASFSGVVSLDDLEGRTLLDARAPERYRGEFEPVDPQAGHIPGAINQPLSENLGQDGRFKSTQELFEQFRGFDRPVVSCGSGVNACHHAVAMAVAGLPIPDLYPGSFSEWSRRGLPVERS